MLSVPRFVPVVNKKALNLSALIVVFVVPPEQNIKSYLSNKIYFSFENNFKIS